MWAAENNLFLSVHFLVKLSLTNASFPAPGWTLKKVPKMFQSILNDKKSPPSLFGVFKCLVSSNNYRTLTFIETVVPQHPPLFLSPRPGMKGCSQFLLCPHFLVSSCHFWLLSPWDQPKGEGMYLFPVAVVISHHKHSSFNNTKLFSTVLKFRSPKPLSLG